MPKTQARNVFQEKDAKISLHSYKIFQACKDNFDFDNIFSITLLNLIDLPLRKNGCMSVVVPPVTRDNNYYLIPGGNVEIISGHPFHLPTMKVQIPTLCYLVYGKVNVSAEDEWKQRMKSIQ